MKEFWCLFWKILKDVLKVRPPRVKAFICGIMDPALTIMKKWCAF